VEENENDIIMVSDTADGDKVNIPSYLINSHEAE
jgi:hypothetical protein